MIIKNKRKEFMEEKQNQENDTETTMKNCRTTKSKAPLKDERMVQDQISNVD
jgi:hypothetical protein